MPQQIYSAEVTEIISYKPVWVVRNGIMLFLFILLVIMAISFVVKYPDVVQARAVLTSINAPREVKIKSTGLLVKLLVKEKDKVEEKQILGYLESTANHSRVIELSSLLSRLENLVKANQLSSVMSYYKSFEPISNQMGELSPALLDFNKNFRELKQYVDAGFYVRKKNMLQKDISYLLRLSNILQEQKGMQTEDVALAQQSLNAQKSLDADKVISPLDYRNEQSKFIGKALSLPQVNSAIVSNENARHEKGKEIAQLENEIAQQREIFLQSVQRFAAAMEDWKSKFLIMAPVGGSVSFAGFAEEKQQVIAGQTIFYIDPGNTSYYAAIVIPQNNFGNVSQGQQVKLKLPAYPYQQFGSIEGKLGTIAAIATDSGFVAKVDLPNKLTTNYKKTLLYRDGLTAQAEIITANTSLAERIFNQLISAVRN